MLYPENVIVVIDTRKTILNKSIIYIEVKNLYIRKLKHLLR